MRLTPAQYRALTGGKAPSEPAGKRRLGDPSPKPGSNSQASESPLEAMLYLQLRALQIVLPEREYAFHPVRRWRFDFAWPELRLAVEVEGGVYSRGRHNRPQGFIGDTEKYNAAAEAGWTVLRYTGTSIRSGKAVEQVQTMIRERAAPESQIRSEPTTRRPAVRA